MIVKKNNAVKKIQSSLKKKKIKISDLFKKLDKFPHILYYRLRQI